MSREEHRCSRPGGPEPYHGGGGKRRAISRPGATAPGRSAARLAWPTLLAAAALVGALAAQPAAGAVACDGSADDDALFAAILAGDAAALERVVASGADLEAECRLPVERVLGHDLHTDVVGWIGLRPLAAAALAPRPRAAIAILAAAGAGADADADEPGDAGLDAVALAALLGRVGALEALLDAGAAADRARPTWAEVLMALGTGGALEPSQGIEIDLTPLHLAAVSRAATAPSVATRLAAAGADLEARTDGGRTALMLAAHGGATETVGALLAAGADVDGTDDAGNTPLLVAAFERRRATALALLAAGADADAVNDDGESALAVAIVNRDVELAEALRAAGAGE